MNYCYFVTSLLLIVAIAFVAREILWAKKFKALSQIAQLYYEMRYQQGYMDRHNSPPPVFPALNMKGAKHKRLRKKIVAQLRGKYFEQVKQYVSTVSTS